MPFVTVVVPAFNEEASIIPCIRQLSEALQQVTYHHEIIVVNDGSTDKTLERAQSTRVNFPSIRTVDLGRNYGKTTALREGVKRAKGDLIAFFDADLQYDPADLVKLIGLAGNGAEVVTGRRDYGAYGLSRTAFSKLYNKILRLVFQLDVADSNCGMKVLTRQVANPKSLFTYGLPLILPLVKTNGVRIIEVRVGLKKRQAGESKYFHNGSFMGGWKNIRDIAYHSAMLVSLLSTLPFRDKYINHRPSLPPLGDC